jgi:putative intracellular protease/amidase/YHS domain-containing protein
VNRRDLLQRSATLGLAAAIPFSSVGSPAPGIPTKVSMNTGGSQPAVAPNQLRPPVRGTIPVACLLSEGAVIIDFCGPWEVFENVMIPGSMDPAFRLYTVAETTQPVRASGGMKIIPDYMLSTAPPPKIIVIPAQSEPSQATVDWIRESTKNTDVTMSVCTGAFVLAKTGLLSGRAATTHHGAYTEFALAYPDISVKRGARFVEDGNLASAGGLSSGIDLSLRVVERYFGRDVARSTAFAMEYQGEGWMNPESNQVYAEMQSTAQHPVCPVCMMDVDPKVAPTSTYLGKAYYFCMPEHKQLFDSAPQKIITLLIPEHRAWPMPLI